MERRLSGTGLRRASILLVVAIAAIPNISGQQVPASRDAQEAAQLPQLGQKLQQILDDKAGYAAAIVQRWESAARASGRWDETYAAGLQSALMNLQPENLLAAGEAPSYEAMMNVLATGRQAKAPLADPGSRAILLDASGRLMTPHALGDPGDDMVYTPVTPCRIVDTRYTFQVYGTRTFDMDNPNGFGFQGGYGGPCGIPYGVARAVAMTITVTNPAAAGYFTAWGLNAMPLSSVLNFNLGNTLANTTIVPVSPGVGADFSLYSPFPADAIIDVVGYFAAPISSPLDCLTSTNSAPVPASVWTHVTVSCPAGRTATGGGFFYIYSTTQGKSSPSGNGWDAGFFTSNGAETGTVYVNCCRLPGR
jgi:hypothetical protein